MFIHDLVLKLHDIYYYADDITGGVSGKSAEEVCLKLKNLAQDMLPSFTEILWRQIHLSLNLWFLVRLATYTILR